MQQTDDDILRRVQAGARNEYVELFNRYYDRVESYARLRLRQSDAAKDIACETFLRAYRSVDRYRVGEGMSYLGYLLTICKRLIITEVGRPVVAVTSSLDDAEQVERLVDASPLPIAHLLEGERRRMVRGALAMLPPDDAEIIHLAFERELSRREIGEIMGKPSITAVTSHLHRAMQKLRAIIGAQGYFGAGDKADDRTVSG